MPVLRLLDRKTVSSQLYRIGWLDAGKWLNCRESDNLFHSAMTVEKLLECSRWSLVKFLRTRQQLELHSKLPVQRIGIEADHVEATAFFWAVGSESAHDHMSSPPNRSGHLTHVSHSVALCGKKMKYGSVMPNIVS